MSQFKLLPFGVSLGISVLTGGYFLGTNVDRVNILCEQFDTLKLDHNILKEKVYDIHTRVCVIDEKISELLERKNK